MKMLQRTLILLCLAFFGCSSTQLRSEAQHDFDAAINRLCQWTGMQRAGPIAGIERRPTDDPGYNVRLRLSVDGARRPFIIRFDSRRRLLSFEPEPFDLSSISQGLGYDSVKSPQDRSRCIAAVDNLNRQLHWAWYGRAAIQRVGSDFIVTYVTVSPAEQQKHMYLDPYVSFLVTPRSTVFASFFGA
jgi:hypothetical protein